MIIIVLIVDDYVVVCDGLCFLLENQLDISVIGEVVDGWEVVDVVFWLKFDVVVMDLVMLYLNGVDVMVLIVEKGEFIWVVMLLMYLIVEYVFWVLQVGVFGYLCKELVGSEVVDVVWMVYVGWCYLSQKIIELVVDDYICKCLVESLFELLSQWECEIL